MVRFFVCAAVCVFLLCMSVSANAQVDILETRTFAPGTVIVPMDGKQSDPIRVFGLLHMLNRRGATFFRVLEPPDVSLVTSEEPSGAVYLGGPVMIPDGIPPEVGLSFPTVNRHTLSQGFTSTAVTRSSKAPRILYISGAIKFGHTDKVLDAMGIQYSKTDVFSVADNPDMLLGYDLIIDDCNGWSGVPIGTSGVPDAVKNNLRAVAVKGGELVFTDIAQWDLVDVFPGYVSVGNIPSTIFPSGVFIPYTVPETPGQFYSPVSEVNILWSYTLATHALSSDVRVLMDAQNYGEEGLYYIAAFYFPYGKGIVEGLGYHPWEQSEPSKTILTQLMGNKFTHTSPGAQCGQMTGGGKLWGKYQPANKTMFVDYGLRLHCNLEERPNHLTVQWGPNNRFTMTKLTQSYCGCDADPSSRSSTQQSNVMEGAGSGTYNYISTGYKVFFKFTDTTKSGAKDTAHIRIENSKGAVVLDASGPVAAGGHATQPCNVIPFPTP